MNTRAILSTYSTISIYQLRHSYWRHCFSSGKSGWSEKLKKYTW